MEIEISYRTEFGKPISIDEVPNLTHYEEVTAFNGKIKRIDSFGNGKLLDIRYYKSEQEQDEEICKALAPLNAIEIAIVTIEIQGNFVYHTAISYFDGVEIGEPQVTIFDQDNNRITEYSLNKETNQPRLSATKIVYDEEGEWKFVFHYNSQGDFFQMIDYTPGNFTQHVFDSSDISSFDLFKWEEMEYYHHALPFTPE